MSCRTRDYTLGALAVCVLLAMTPPSISVPDTPSMELHGDPDGLGMSPTSQMGPHPDPSGLAPEGTSSASMESYRRSAKMGPHPDPTG